MGNSCKTLPADRKTDISIQTYHPFDLPLGKLKPSQVEEKLKTDFVKHFFENFL